MKKIYLFIIFFTALLSSSCNKWLDVKLINMREDSQQFSTENGFKEALAGIYFNMSNPVLYGQTLSFGALDVMSRTYDYGQVMMGYRMYRDYEYKDADMERIMNSVWFSMYSNLASINHILMWSDKNKSVLSQNAYNQIRGEALGLRAFLQYDIYRLFAPDIKQNKNISLLPYQLNFDVKTPEVYSTEAYLQYVVKDLIDANELLRNDPITEVIPYKIDLVANKDFADQYVARMNLYAVKALLARVYMDIGGDKIQEARRLAEEVIQSGKFALLNGNKSINVAKANQDLLFSDEHIFSLRNKNIRENAKGLHKLVISSDGNLSMSPGFKPLIYENDNDDYRLNWFDQLYIIKYNVDNTASFFPKVPLIKLSEMYLIAAEGWMNDNPTKAAELLQQFKQSRTTKNIALETVDVNTIVKEYRKEFLFEGQLFFLYKRLNHTILGNTLGEDMDASSQVFVIPIPKEEIENGHRKTNN